MCCTQCTTSTANVITMLLTKHQYPRPSPDHSLVGSGLHTSINSHALHAKATINVLPHIVNTSPYTSLFYITMPLLQDYSFPPKHLRPRARRRGSRHLKPRGRAVHPTRTRHARSAAGQQPAAHVASGAQQAGQCEHSTATCLA
jgi:hypothetical protein